MTNEVELMQSVGLVGFKHFVGGLWWVVSVAIACHKKMAACGACGTMAACGACGTVLTCSIASQSIS